MNNRKLNLIQEASAAYPSLRINDAMYNFLRYKYQSVQSLADLIAFHLTRRYVYDFDGVDDYAVLATRAINPDGDIDVEFETGPVVPAAGGIEYTVLSQCLTSTFASKEFNLYFNSAVGALQIQVGGSYSPSNAAVSLAPNTRYRALLQGTSLQFFRNGQSLFSAPFTRGAAREPTAQTVLMASTHGTPTTFRAFGRGIFYNVRVNGVLWRMDQRNQAIQPSTPAGNNMTLVNTTSDRWQEVPQ